MKEPTGSEKQGKTKSKRGGKKQGVADRESKDSSAASSRLEEATGTDGADVSGAEGEALTAPHSEEESTRKKSKSEES